MNRGEIRAHLRRTEWRGFPDVFIVTPEVSTVKGDTLYARSKEEDARAADRLIANVFEHPRVFARKLPSLFDLPVASGMIQINRVSHTGADGYHRLAFAAVFDGNLEPVEYFIIEDS